MSDDIISKLTSGSKFIIRHSDGSFINNGGNKPEIFHGMEAAKEKLKWLLANDVRPGKYFCPVPHPVVPG